MQLLPVLPSPTVPLYPSQLTYYYRYYCNQHRTQLKELSLSHNEQQLTCYRYNCYHCRLQLKELYLSHNAITRVAGLDYFRSARLGFRV